VLLRTGNFDLTGEHFRWVSDFEVAETMRPPWARSGGSRGAGSTARTSCGRANRPCQHARDAWERSGLHPSAARHERVRELETRRGRRERRAGNAAGAARARARAGRARPRSRRPRSASPRANRSSRPVQRSSARSGSERENARYRRAPRRPTGRRPS
jgi:hypothetical protein